jgi:hypothetical protein
MDGWSSPATSRVRDSRAPRSTAARIALQARAVADHGEISAIAAGFAFVAFGAGFGAAFGGFGLGFGAGVAPGLQRLGGGESRLGCGLENRGARDFGARGESGHVGRHPTTPAGFTGRPSACRGG